VGDTVRIEAQAWGDWRFAALANALGIDRYSALARCAYLWGVCTSSGSYFVPPAVCGGVLERPPAEAVAALVGAFLAEETPEGVRLKGTKGRVEWKDKLKRAGRRGGAVRAAQAGRSAEGTFVSAATGVQTPHQAPSRPGADTRQTQTSPTATATATAIQGLPGVAELVRQSKAAGVTQNKVAQACLVGNKTVSLWFRGKAAPEPGHLEQWRRLIEAKRANRASGDHGAFVAWFTEAFEKHTGSRPTWGPVQGRQVKELLAAHGLDELKRRAATMFTQSPRYPAEQPTLQCLHRHCDAFATTKGRPPLGGSSLAAHEAAREGRRR